MAEQSAAERVADDLRTAVIEARLRSDIRLKDQEVADHYSVSRTTARDALRILVQDGLAVSRLNSGVSVRRLDIDEVHDIYEVRRVLETSALARVSTAPEEVFDDMRRILDEGVSAAEAGDGDAAGAASARFHQAVVSFFGSPMLDKFFSNVIAQLRLAIAIVPEVLDFEDRWAVRDREIFELIIGGQQSLARLALTAYLDDAEAELIGALRAHDRGKTPPVFTAPSHKESNVHRSRISGQVR